ncbi:Integrin alpha-3 [Nymphon striatum]|nr:Integrin alpha-3 [Nymphon striatum]
MQLRDIKAIGMAQNLPVKPLNDEPNRNNSKGRKVSNTVLGLGVAALLATGIGGVSAMGSSNAGLSQGLGGVAGFAEAGDYFAAAVATGDFNGDGRDDLLVGAPQENIGSLSNAGAFHVLYGSANGVSATGDVVLHQDSDSVVGVGEVEDLVGTSVASGDFNGDGFDDVAVGAPGENVGSLVDAGGVHVFYGSASGLTATGDQFLHQDASGVAGVAEAYDEFGFSLAAGDFNGDGRDDLAVGAPGEGIGSKAAAGGMHIFYGTTNGLSTGNDVFLHQDSKNVAGTAEAGDMMGETLAAGDFDADGIDDLVAGAPGEGIGSKTAAGGIHLLYGSGNGISTAGNVFWHQDTAGIDGSAEPDDRFGAALAVGDFDGSGGDDLAVGAPGEDLGSIGDAGGVHILYSIGSGDGLSTAGDDFVHQDSAGVPGQAEPGDEVRPSACSRRPQRRWPRRTGRWFSRRRCLWYSQRWHSQPVQRNGLGSCGRQSKLAPG